MRHIALLLQLIGLALLLLLGVGGNVAATADVARTTALLQRSLLLEFAVRHKQIPRLTYFTCRNPATNTNINSNNDTGNRGGNLQQLRVAYDAKNVQLIQSLYQDKDRVAAAASNRLFVRIVLLDVLRQPNAKPGRAGQRGGGGPGGGNRPMAMGARGGGAAAARAEWLDSVLKVEALRQIVAVDLACGMLSRRFLEMVSADPTEHPFSLSLSTPTPTLFERLQPRCSTTINITGY